MKKLCLLLVLFSMFSCSSDDSEGMAVNEANLSGKWYFESAKNGDEDYVLYNNQCASKKDYVEFAADGTLKSVNYTQNCEENTDVPAGVWSLEGRNLTISNPDSGGLESTYEVKILSGYKLSLVQSLEQEDDTVEINIINFSRI